MSTRARRLPVYLLLDCSSSMMGEPIEAVRQGVETLINELKNDPQALETVWISLITFSSVAQQISPLTELRKFSMPKLCVGGVTALGGALTVLRECIAREVRQITEVQEGDWMPLVFIVIDGKHTDEEEFDRQVQDIKSLKVANIIAVGAGPYVEQENLKRITDNVVLMNSASAGDLAKFFAWVDDPVKTSAKSLEDKPDSGIQLPPPLRDLQLYSKIHLNRDRSV